MKKVCCDFCKREFAQNENYIKLKMQISSLSVEQEQISQEEFENNIIAQSPLDSQTRTNTNMEVCNDCISKMLVAMEGAEDDDNTSTEESCKELQKKTN